MVRLVRVAMPRISFERARTLMAQPFEIGIQSLVKRKSSRTCTKTFLD